MDEIVTQALRKWPAVPHCYGWLALDARGAWRMRDERAQHLGLAGDRVTQAALLGFINRNYAADGRGCWYFQNGPQRVYVNLASTPFVARTDPQQGMVLHTGAALGAIDAAYLTEAGEFIVVEGATVAQVDDRDLAQLMGALELDGHAAPDEALLAWLEGGAGRLTWRYQAQCIAVERIAGADLAGRFGFQRLPASQAASQAA